MGSPSPDLALRREAPGRLTTILVRPTLRLREDGGLHDPTRDLVGVDVGRRAKRSLFAYAVRLSHVEEECLELFVAWETVERVSDVEATVQGPGTPADYGRGAIIIVAGQRLEPHAR